MNVFCTDPDPALSAEALDDKRGMKMIVESAQMLSTALYYVSRSAWQDLNAGVRTVPWQTPPHRRVYKPVFPNHPCNLWVRASSGNWNWLMQHATRLCRLYQQTYDRTHMCEYTLQELWDSSIVQRFPKHEQTPFPNSARNLKRGLDFSHVADTHEAYRLYLQARWTQDVRPPTWHGRNVPHWLLAK